MSFLRTHLPLIITLLLVVATGFAAMNTQNNLLFWAAGLLASAVILSALLSHIAIRSLEVRRLDPKHGAVGQPLVVQYAITNRSRLLPAFNILIDELPNRGSANWHRFMRPARAWVMHVGPGETVHGEVVFWPKRRGEVAFGALRCHTSFPFGIVRRARVHHQPAHTLVYPRLYALRRGVVESIVPSGPLGMKLSSRPGGGDDYFGLREYKPGDGRRQIAWKRSASMETLIIKERTLPSPPRLRIVLNLTAPTSALAPEGDVSARELEERAISLAATMLDAAHRAGYEVGLSVLGSEVPVTPLRRSHWHLEKIMGALASIDLDAPRSRPLARSLADAERAGVVVIHPGRVNPAVIRADAWHFASGQIERLVIGRLERDDRAHSSISSAATVAPPDTSVRPASTTTGAHDASEVAA